MRDWIDWDAEYDRLMERSRAERAAAEAKAEQEAARRTQEHEDSEIAALIKNDPVCGYTRLVEALARRHGITIEWRSVMPAGVDGYAGRRRITIRPIDRTAPEVRAAVGLHEIGHVLAGRCPNRGAHRRDPEVLDWWQCMECERLAWANALRLYPFTKRMFERLQSSLRYYRQRTPASAGVNAATERMVRLGWHEDRQRRAQWASRVERQRLAMASLARDIARTGMDTKRR